MYLEEIVRRIREFDGKSKSPTIAVGDEETVVGAMQEGSDLVKMHSLIGSLIDEARDNTKALMARNESGELTEPEALVALSELRQKANEIAFLKECFWNSVRYAFGVWSGPIAIRENWQVVSYDEEDSPMIDAALMIIDRPFREEEEG
jgi:hypothetical protein